jgi:hypothetical protein
MRFVQVRNSLETRALGLNIRDKQTKDWNAHHPAVGYIVSKLAHDDCTS